MDTEEYNTQVRKEIQHLTAMILQFSELHIQYKQICANDNKVVLSKELAGSLNY